MLEQSEGERREEVGVPGLVPNSPTAPCKDWLLF